jgi:hypothetical protein
MSSADSSGCSVHQVTIVWDRMFGSYAEETHRPTYGSTADIDSFNPFVLQYREYGLIIRDIRRAQNWRERLGYLVGPPGWRPRLVEQKTPADTSV